MNLRSAAVAVFLLHVLGVPSLAGRVALVAGGGEGGDGSPAARAKLHEPFGFVSGADGSAYVVEYGANRVRRIDPKGVLTMTAGTGEKGSAGDGGPADKAQLFTPHSIDLGPDGCLYVADTGNSRVRKIDLKSGTISPFAGTGKKGSSGDGGPAADVQFGNLYCVAFNPQGTRLVLTDLDNRKIRAVDMKTGTVTTLAGNGEKGVPKDGAEATKAPLVDPRAALMDAAGNLYILERSGHALRVVDPAGKIRTVVGTGKAGATGDGGPARGHAQRPQAPVRRRRRECHYRRHREPPGPQVPPEGGQDRPSRRDGKARLRRRRRHTRPSRAEPPPRRLRRPRRHPLHQRQRERPGAEGRAVSRPLCRPL